MDIGAGIARGISSAGYAAGDMLSKQALEQERSKLEEERTMRVAENMMRLKDEAAGRERARISGYAAPVTDFQSGATGIAAANAGLTSSDTVGADEGIGVDVQNRTRAPTSREMQTRAIAGGDVLAYKVFGEEGNKTDDNARLDRKEVKDEKKQQSDDEKWKTQFNELTHHNKAVEAKAAAELKLKGKDRKELSSAMADYTAAVKFRTRMSLDSRPEDIAMVDADLNAGAARLSQFGLKVPGAETGKRGSMKVVKGEIGEGDSLIHEDSKGGVTRVDPKALPAYGAGGAATSPEATAQSDAQRAVSTGRITKADANKRLQAAGFKPI